MIPAGWTWLARALLLMLAGCVAEPPPVVGPAGQPAGRWREQIHWVPMRDAGGATHLLYTRICRPAGEQPARVVVINHGSPPNAADRLMRRPVACDSEAAEWFLGRGFLVVAGMRRGHGPTGGALAETSGQCSAIEYARAGREAARDVDAIVAYATGLPYARHDRVAVVGQSTGGWSTIGYNSVAHPLVSTMINMAGGRGGHVNSLPNSNCRPDQLAAAAGILGRTATTPMLWVYTVNDTYFGPKLATAMHDAFVRAGGKAELVQLGAFGTDGHMLFLARGGSALWGPLVERALATQPSGEGR